MKKKKAKTKKSVQKMQKNTMKNKPWTSDKSMYETKVIFFFFFEDGKKRKN